jgi:dTMP kinase
MHQPTRVPDTDTVTINPMGGTWISFEGLDGCGKSTQAARLTQRLNAISVREPGGSPLGANIRELLLHTDTDIDPRSEVLLFAADRAQLARHVIAPALQAGRDVVSDRSVWSSVAYQGYGRGIGADEVIAVNDWALAGLWPHVVVYLDGDPTTLAARLGGDLDRMERAGSSFFERAADGFRDQARQRGWVVIDAHQDAEQVETAVWSAVGARLPLSGTPTR